jgi:thiamine biosynthesis lipoprotein
MPGSQDTDLDGSELASISRATAPLPGRHRVEQIMGTAIDLDLRDVSVDAEALEAAFEFLRDIDRRFSPYKPDSEVSRLIRGEIDESGASPELRSVLSLCEQIRESSNGYFDIRSHRPDGRPDPTGLVKGWALERAAGVLDGAGARNYCVNGGGDVIAIGEAEPGQSWRVGIRHPLIANRLASVLALSDESVATSGAYERGRHIRNPLTGVASDGLLSVTIVGPSLALADAYATAAFAMGPDCLDWVARLTGFEACAITEADARGEARLVWTPGFDRYFADPPTRETA